MAEHTEDIILRVNVMAENVEKQMTKIADSMESSVKSINKVVNKVNKTEKAGKAGTKVFKAFNAQMLTLGMTTKFLSDTMFGLLQPAMEAAGIFEIIGVILMVLFLPIIMAVMPFLLQLMDFFINLPEPVKLLIGGLVLFVAIGAKIISFFALLLTGWPSILGFFSSIWGIILRVGVLIAPFFSAIGTAIAGIVATIGWPITALIAIIVLLWLAWQTNFGNMRKHFDEFVAGVVQIFNGFITFVRGIMTILIGILTLNPQTIANGFQMVINAVMQVIRGFIGVGTGIIGFIVDGIKQAGSWIWNALCSIPIVGPIIAAMGSGLAQVAGSVASFAGSLASSIGNFVTGHGGYIGGDKDYVTKSGLLYEGMGKTETYSPNISINANIASDMDLRRIAGSLNQYMYEEYRRLNR